MADGKCVIIGEVLKKYFKERHMTQQAIADVLGVSQGAVTALLNGKPFGSKTAQAWSDNFGFNITWLLTGEGEMLKNSIQDISTDRQEVTLVPLLPVSAQGGRLNDFVVSVRKEDCEKLISPIKDADFAIMISGDSMAPEYPSGSKVLVKKINSKSFIEWGRCYLLDTCNGSIVKKLSPPVENDEVFGKDYFTCVSVNPDPLYSPFRVPTCDVYGIYRVMMLLSEK